MRKTGDHTGSPLPSYAAGTHHFSSGRTQFAPTVLTIITAVFTERLNYSNLIIGSVGNAVPGVPWDLMCFHGQPQGLSLRFFSICSGRCPHRPKVIYLIIRLRRIGSSGRRTLRILSKPCIFSERRGRRSLRTICDDIGHFQVFKRILLKLCVFRRANKVRPYRVTVAFV